MQKNNYNIDNRKVIFVFISIAIIVIVLGLNYLRDILYDPFIVEVSNSTQKAIEAAREEREVTIADLKERDTDNDGLTDHQELYQYNTSIFLEDTDSDGFTDYDEVMQGFSPLCPKGENCDFLSLITPNSKLSDVVGDVVKNSDLTILQVTLNEFRQFLLDNNIPQEDVDSLSDNDLLTLLSALNESNLDNNVSIEDFDANEIRDFLLNQPGADLEEINNLSDEELLNIRDKLIQK